MIRKYIYLDHREDCDSERTDKEVALLKGTLESVPQEIPDVERKRLVAEEVPGCLPGVEAAAERLEEV